MALATVCLPFVGCGLEPAGSAPASTSEGTTSSSSSTNSSGSAGAGGMASAGSSGSGAMAGAGGMGGNGGVECVDDGQGSCEPWWNKNYTLRRRIVVTPAGNPQAVTDFPWLIRIDATHIDYAKTSAQGADLRFVAADGKTLLAHEIEAWNVNNTSYVWVRLPNIPAEGTGEVTIWMYYGNSVDNLPKPHAPSDTWNPGFVSVHHLHNSFADSTSGNHDGMSPTAPTSTAGQIANGMSFDGFDDQINLPKEADFDFNTNMTVSAWVAVKNFTKDWQSLVTKGDNSWRIQRLGQSNSLAFATSSPGGPNDNFGGTVNLVDNTFHHIVIVYNGAKKRIYDNGALDVEKDFTLDILKNNYEVCIGNNLQYADRQFEGQMDEVRISDVPRPASWVALEYNNVMKDQMTAWSNDQVPPP